jgi:hypothetical protein
MMAMLMILASHRSILADAVFNLKSVDPANVAFYTIRAGGNLHYAVNQVIKLQGGPVVIVKLASRWLHRGFAH